MPRFQHRNTCMSSQDNVLPSEATSLAVGPKKCNIGRVQEEDLKIVIINIFKDFNEHWMRNY